MVIMVSSRARKPIFMLIIFGGLRERLHRLSTNIHWIEDGEKGGSFLSRFCPSDLLLSVASNRNGFIIYSCVHKYLRVGVSESAHVLFKIQEV